MVYTPYFPALPRRIRIPYFRINVFIRRIYGNTRRISVHAPYSCHLLLGNFKPQPFCSWLEPVIVKEATDGVEGLVCKLSA